MEIKNYDEVEEAITILAKLQVKKLQKEATLTAKINKLKEESKIALKDDLDEAKVLEKAIKAFCDDNKQDFATHRSKKFSVGEIGYRVVKSVAIPRAKDKVEKIIKILNALKLYACVSVQEGLNKEELKDLDDTQLSKLGLSKSVKDSFRIVANIEKIGAK